MRVPSPDCPGLILALVVLPLFLFQDGQNLYGVSPVKQSFGWHGGCRRLMWAALDFSITAVTPRRVDVSKDREVKVGNSFECFCGGVFAQAVRKSCEPSGLFGL